MPFVSLVYRKQKMGLAALAERVLGVTMEKNWRIRCGNWDADNLRIRQIVYAMNDAMVGSHIFLRLVKSKLDEENMVTSVVTPVGESLHVNNNLSTHSGSEWHGEMVWVETSPSFFFTDGIEVLTIMGDLRVLESEHDKDKGYLHKEEVLFLLQDSVFCQRASLLCQEVDSVSCNVKSITDKDKSEKEGGVAETCNKKLIRRGPCRKSPLYMKCMLVAPDGSTLCTVDRKKADWYIEKRLGK